ncbi:carbon-nitrogen hydrolase family protein [Desulfobacca acetoxidans]|uniref:Nitrilase/cyanide hydratase and apolipoprotein N-acyltransferase n=1 Tax=Desulfobacca acetoxidans (strain ATCC 700848 / DSM 11109 / ASRB2) TaxID=880072 RepID=F2NHR0_DESAR|nr:carbon-nitrogen hydrolase family protein [Desulfobacca acetoxidans]AEB09395.1 Nitrilase/cyanide hydratase and apolipoprotein N-acyltransferase [Desulfobacca acetoxidans DSM 11109]
MWAAVIQMQSIGDLNYNCERAHRLVEAAAGRGAKLIALPEYFSCLGPPESIRAHAQLLDGPLVQGFQQQARDKGVFLLLGSIPERSAESEKIYNTAVLLQPSGEILACYRKIHLFDIDIPGRVRFRESDHILPGKEIIATALPGEEFTVGLTICYDLRFPELFRALVSRGAEIILTPAAFSQVTGRDHWEVLLRARAIENQTYILAPAQYPHPAQSLRTYGRSLIVDPWGVVLAQAADREDIIYADLDRRHLQRLRVELPCLASRCL